MVSRTSRVLPSPTARRTQYAQRRPRTARSGTPDPPTGGASWGWYSARSSSRRDPHRAWFNWRSMKLRRAPKAGKGRSRICFDCLPSLWEPALTGQKLLQEFLPSSQLSDATRELVHALLEVPLRAGRPSRAIQQPILEPSQTTPVAPPGHTQDNHTGDRGAKQTEENAFIHGSCPVGERWNVRAISSRVSGSRTPVLGPSKCAHSETDGAASIPHLTPRDL